MSKKSVICFGEVLWDCLPSGRFPGGAPMNVAYHLSQLGYYSAVVSAVGQDELGDEILTLLQKSNVETRFITRHADLPTGRVLASISENGDAHYQILENVAWDKIEATPELKEQLPSADAIIFGSLAQRSAHNLENLLNLLQTPTHAKRIFDVNLRAPFDSVERVQQLAKYADMIKLNDQEAEILTGISSDSGTLDIRLIKMAKTLESQTGCSTICITAGKHGAGMLYKGEWFFEKGQTVKVADTVGSGDAFLASITYNITQERSNPRKLLQQACRLGEWVATQKGATPSYPKKLVECLQSSEHVSQEQKML